ncbi:MAG TPA: ShlB/FhaC/HecB family hemolysin secretion/activation protein [Hyphomicrobiaceae bacterium]|nr:ShlB/FhaC/HecB family hemolysin secretion/activation protein [Hyphomicrobiaceae bacterium]
MTAVALLSAAVGWGGIIQPAVAQTSEQGDRLLKEREAEALRKRAEEGPSGLDVRADPVKKPAKEAQCIAIRTIDVQGATLLPEEELSAVVTEFRRPCMGSSSIGALLQAISKRYIDRGYITSRALLPEQDLASGVLKVQVVEGHVESIEYLEERDGVTAPGAGRKVATAFPGMTGRSLHLRDIEQAIDQINRLQSNKATIDLKPGKELGGTALVVRNKIADEVRGHIRTTAEGDRHRHEMRADVFVEADDLLGISDTWYLAYSGAASSNSISFSASAPYGYWLLSASGSYSENLDQLSATSDLFHRAAASTVSIDRLVFRDSKSKLRVGTSFTHRWSDRYVNDAALASQKLSIAGAHVTYEHFLPSAFLSLTIGTDLGLRFFGVDPDGDPDDGAPQASFRKLRASGSYYRALLPGLTIYSAGAGQMTHDPLYGTEQLEIGGHETVRGFRFARTAGDTGAYVQTTLSYSLAALFASPTAAPGATQAGGGTAGRRTPSATVSDPWTFEGVVSRFSPFLFVDAGSTHNIANDHRNYMVGAGAGIRFTSDRASADLTAAVPVGHSNDLTPSDFEVRLGVTVKLF